MNKYQTLDSPPPRESNFSQNILEHLKFNRKVKATLHSQINDDLHVNDNKSIVFIKMPKQHNNHIKSFRSSLYESSLKRLKQQKVTLVKQSVIPSINSRKTYETFEEEAIKRALKDSTPKKHQNLPNLHKLVGEQTRKHFSYFQRSKDKSDDQLFEDKETANQVQKYLDSKRKSTFEVDGSTLGYHNLKEKYLELKQLSLTNQKKSQLLDKAQYRRYDPERHVEQYEAKYKMEKLIEEHMNRYKRKDFFQTKVNGFKTMIYPHKEAQIPHEQEKKERKRVLQINRQHQHVENFVRKKRRSYYPTNTLNSYSQPKTDIKHRNNQSGKQTISNPRTNPSRLENLIQCAPWETDADY